MGTRQWNIYVTQYTCGQEDVAGPPGCLQYHTGTTGLMKSFGYPSSNTNAATDASTTHLQNQVYQICIRRSSSYCYICYSQWDTAGSFGTNISIDAGAAQSMVGTACIDDYVVIPGGTTATIAAINDLTIGTVSRYCGRFLNIAAEIAADITICSRNIPFRVGVVFNDEEICTITNAAIACEPDQTPGGIIGFA